MKSKYNYFFSYLWKQLLALMESKYNKEDEIETIFV